MKNETLTHNATKEKNAVSSMSGRQRLLSGGLILLCILMALLLAAFIAVSAVILESHTYKRAARNEAYLAGVESAAVDIMKDAAAEYGLSKTMLLQHVKSKDIRKLAQRNAAEAALVLKGSQVIYGNSFDRASLETDIYKFYAQRLSDPEAATAPGTAPSENTADTEQGNAAAPTPDAQKSAVTSAETIPNIEAQDTAPLLWNAEEDPEREAQREQADEMAAEIAGRIDEAVRVIDMEQVVYAYSEGYALDWLRFMGRGGVLLPLVLLGVLLLLLYRFTWERGFSRRLAGVGFASGVCLLVCAGVIPAMGLFSFSVKPVQLAVLYGSMTRGLFAELLVMAVLWFVVGYVAVRAAMGRPVSTRWLKAFFSRLRPDAGTADAADPETPDVPTDSGESPIDDIASARDRAAGSDDTRSNAALLETIKKAAADSTNSLLGRKHR